MATWTTIADARLEPDKPARSIDALALRDNPIAIAENAPNAPKVDQYYLLITTSTTWTVPKTGQYWIDLIGGGGGGGYGSGGSGYGAGGGGSGYAASKMLTLTQGDTYPIVIGSAGGGGVGASGFGGAATTGFGLSAAGGGGGGAAGAGGTGHSSGRNSSGAGGGNGGSAPLLVPDINATAGVNNGGIPGGSGGFGYGAGGGGGAGAVGGGAGAQGAVIIRGI